MSAAGPDKPVGIGRILTMLVPLFLQYRQRLLLGFFALVCVDLIQLIIPKFIRFGVDALAQGSASRVSLLGLGAAIIGAALCVVLLRFVWRLLIIGFSRILEKSIRDRLFAHILRMDQPFFERWKTGDLMAHASNDLNAIQMACGMGLVAAVDALVMTVAGIGFMVAISPRLTVIALLPMPLLAVSTRILSARLHHRFNLVQEQFSLLTEFARTTLASIQLIQGYTLERFQGQRFAKLGNQYVRSNLNVAVVQGALFPLSTLIGNTGMLLVLYFGGRQVMTGVITIGEFVAFVTYMQMLIWPMMAVGWVANIVQRGATSLRRIHRLLSERPIITDGTCELTLPVTQVEYRLQNLSFSYPGTNRQVLTDITLDIEPGVLGMTGKTGSGKSTLCKLLLRIYPVKQQSLFFNGQDVNDLPVDALRAHIAYVPQEATLFSDTIAGNIAFGVADAEREEIIQAAKAAAFHTEIMRLPKGYDTLVGERGVKLSGGQRQRLALARALLCNRPFLLIDDGLNAIDVETEQEVLQGLLTATALKTVVIVSHRLNVLQLADRILILEDGRIAAEGTHADLLHHAFYRTMIHKQKADA